MQEESDAQIGAILERLRIRLGLENKESTLDLRHDGPSTPPQELVAAPDPMVLFTDAREKFQSTMKLGLDRLRDEVRELRVAFHEDFNEMIQKIVNIESESFPVTENSVLPNAMVLQEDLVKEPEEIDEMITQSQVRFSFWEFRHGDNLLGIKGIEFLVTDQSLGIKHVKNQLLSDFQNHSHICVWLAQQNEYLYGLEAWKEAGNFENLPKVTTTFLAHQLFEQMLLRRKENQQRILKKMLKSKKFKYKLKKQHGINVATLKVIWLLKICTTSSSLFTAMRRSMLGLGAEIAKNLIFTGVTSVTQHDGRAVELWDLANNFVFYEDDIGKNWADGEDKKYSTTAEVVYGEDAETLVMDEDIQPLEQLIIKPGRDVRFEVGVKDISTYVSTEFLVGLMSNPTLMRNVALVGHLQHGKTVVLDMLVEQTHHMSTLNVKNEKYMTYTGARDDEQEVNNSIKAVTMSLIIEDSRSKSYLCNVIDTPGYVNFSNAMTASLHLSAGSVLLVDAAEGVMVNTEKAIRHAIQDHLPIVVVVTHHERNWFMLVRSAFVVNLWHSELFYDASHYRQTIRKLISLQTTRSSMGFVSAYWAFTQHAVVGRKSDEDAYTSMANASSELDWFSHLLLTHHVHLVDYIALFCPNHAAFNIINNYVLPELQWQQVFTCNPSPNTKAYSHCLFWLVQINP